MGLLRFTLFSSIILFVIVLLDHSGQISWKEEGGRIIYLIVLLSFLLFSFFSRKISLSEVVKNIFIWAVIFIVLIGLYSQKDGFKRLFAEILQEINPSKAVGNNTGEIVVLKGRDGHYRINGSINGKRMVFLVDTGASVTSINTLQAKSAGIDITNLNYNNYVSTANGINKVALTKIKSLCAYDICKKNVKVFVVKKGLSKPLLGMNFLNSLESFEFSQDKLTIKG